MRIPRPSLLTLTTALLVVLLPTLALLQYQWVGQVSQAERERMQTHLRNAALQFHESLDGEILRAAANLQIGSATAREGSSERYADRYEAWASTAAHPQLVEQVYLIDDGGGATRLRRWNPDTRALEPCEWPAKLLASKEAFEQDRAAFGDTATFNRQPPFIAEPSILLAPLRQTPPGLGGTDSGPVFGFTVIQLDMRYIQSRLLPELAQRFFALGDDSGYRVAVLSNEPAGNAIYRSDDDAPLEPATADAVEPLFGVPQRGFFGRGFGPRGDNRRQLAVVIRGAGPGIPSLDAGQGPNVRDLGRWVLLAQHESGSLETYVTWVRRRNLGISFGILLLLSFTIGMLALSSKRAQRLARQQMEFVAGVSHELRTPIAVIRAASENLAQGVVASPERVKRYGETIGTESRRLGDMVERVLQYAGIEAGRVIALTTPLEPLAVIEAALQATSSVVASAGATIESRLPERLPMVLGDSTALASAVQNLITNAVKYGGPDKWVGVSATEGTGGRSREVRISVEDHGPGIPQADLAHVFEPFYRGTDATHAQIQGNGLGLSIVKRIVEAHGGRVSVSTSVGQGTTFTLHLPVATHTPATERMDLGAQRATAHS